jgi:hypothetical protein
MTCSNNAIVLRDARSHDRLRGPDLIRRVMCCGLFAAFVGVSGTARGEVPGAMSAIVAGDCKSAGQAINEGLQRDDAQALFLAGFLYDRTDCVTRDAARAARLYRRAAVLGDVDAPGYLGLLYGLGRGVPQDYAAAHRAFVGRDPAEAPSAAEAPNEVALGYVETVAHLAAREVVYPISANTVGLEATMDVVLDPASGRVTFDHVKVGTEVGSHLPRTASFTDPVEQAYRSAIAAAPKPPAYASPATAYATHWEFLMRRGPSNIKVRLEGYIGLGDTTVVR